MSQILDTSIEYLKGVGPARAKLLHEELGVKTYRDLIYTFPFRYIDKTQLSPIAALRESEVAIQFKAKVTKINVVKGKRTSRLEASLSDGQSMVKAMWFQGVKWVSESLSEGTEYLFYGKGSMYGKTLTITHPEFEVYSSQALANKTFEPVYSSTEKLNKSKLDSKVRRRLIRQVFDKLRSGDLVENLSPSLNKQLGMLNHAKAVYLMHFPSNAEETMEAIKRIKFEELFFLQLSLLFNRQYRLQKLKGAEFTQVGDYFNRYYKEKIPFELTGAQKRVIKEIRNDLGNGVQMNRLLQGDVGSGKTMVALLTMLLALDNGYQACMMAPTEILALQHYHSIKEELRDLGINVGFLSGSIKGKKRQEILQLLKDGVIHILIGTHALIEDWVVFRELGIAIIDEQHRFGVAQRAALWSKTDGIAPHILVMTATPIPRTLALTAYGDLDVSVIDEMPPGRKPIVTVHRFDNRRVDVYKFLEEQMELGRQVYIVYPLIEESAQLDLANLDEGYDRILHRFPRPKYQISVVHGQMKAEDKESEMQRFAKGETQIMIATTVIEVGVNVPNASVMLIENAERFGLAQLHQLRGRVGRGSDDSYCILMTSYKLSTNGKKRIATMVRTQDGFEIAEVDLELRGEGNLEGTQQSGVAQTQIANIIRDRELMEFARTIAKSIIHNDPYLTAPENQNIHNRIRRMKNYKKSWGRIS